MTSLPCQIAPLPSPVYGLTAGLVGDTVFACGGFHHYYREIVTSRQMVSNKIPQKSLTFWLRAECYEYSRHSKRWAISRLRLENSTAYPASAEDSLVTNQIFKFFIEMNLKRRR